MPLIFGQINSTCKISELRVFNIKAFLKNELEL